LLILLFGASAGPGCVKVIDERADGGAAPTSDGAPSADAGAGVPDAFQAPTSCREIRSCAFQCGEDRTCAARCVSTAPSAARQLYDQAQACSQQVCPTQDIECRCDQECFGGGACHEIVDECDEAISDPFCDGPCH
jgi:hypothetical protein